MATALSEGAAIDGVRVELKAASARMATYYLAIAPSFEVVRTDWMGRVIMTGRPPQLIGKDCYA